MDEGQGRPGSRLTRPMWIVLGFVFVALGFIGALLPLMPTTIFLILAVGCFARSSPRLETWLLTHKRFGPTLVAWREEGAIPPRAKMFACGGIALGYAIFWWGARPSLWVDLVVALVMGGCAAFILSRPSPRPRDPAQ
ncbi:YbaN family protein [Sphingomonas sp. HITSZ_GF]|uniref:YbaN family protein n=1 Tax=Sphingomonas sp. HITSZ_GF TaxID=3037247 RepID=UPI00240E9046|nr:YbaN family protein [Sphingomonas sp. HITSZ_GF]MDG2532097.1 YbaN family protein [Sphingomonas sp. HITSZ_GF]